MNKREGAGVNIPVIYEDEWLVAVNKPSGLLTIPTPKKEPRTLTSILNDDLKEKGISYRLHPCHRLDRETSGIILYAKGKSAQKKMMQGFKEKKITKRYIAFVQGAMPKNYGEVNQAIDGQSAITRYKVIQRRKDFTVIEAEPLTGRKNQIRIHFKGMGHPLVGETKFAFRKDFLLRAKRLCLHAKEIGFIHPATGKQMLLSVDLPRDLKEFLEKHPA